MVWRLTGLKIFLHEHWSSHHGNQSIQFNHQSIFKGNTSSSRIEQWRCSNHNFTATQTVGHQPNQRTHCICNLLCALRTIQKTQSQSTSTLTKIYSNHYHVFFSVGCNSIHTLRRPFQICGLFNFNVGYLWFQDLGIFLWDIQQPTAITHQSFVWSCQHQRVFKCLSYSSADK